MDLPKNSLMQQLDRYTAQVVVSIVDNSINAHKVH